MEVWAFLQLDGADCPTWGYLRRSQVLNTPSVRKRIQGQQQPADFDPLLLRPHAMVEACREVICLYCLGPVAD